MTISAEQAERLIKLAVKAKENAYVPYSDFKVGAAVLTASGRIFSGCNIQNVSFGANVCAEHTAVLKAVSEGEREIVAVAVSGPLADKPTFPCGICRQVICEFAQNREIPIFAANRDGSLCEIFSLSELLPCSFDSLK